MSRRPFHLAFLQGSSVQAWGENWTGHIGTTWEQPGLFLDMARSLGRACFDYIRQDPSVVAALTFCICIVSTFGTFAYPPYLLARLVATLDQVSAGRIGGTWARTCGLDGLVAMTTAAAAPCECLRR